ncbi:MAG: VPLPA-CTERM sorting domain-containing protein [Pseudomonadota bacterium]
MRPFLPVAVCAALLSPTLALGASLSSLVAGATLSIDDVTFSNFTATQVDGQVIDISNVNLTTTSTASYVQLEIVFLPSVLLTADAFTEWELSFSADVTGGTGRQFVEERLFISSSTRNGNTQDSAFLELATSTLLVEQTDTSVVSLDTNMLAPTGTVVPDFALTGEAFGADSVALFLARYRLDLADAPSAVVPLPASFGLLALGLGAAGLMRRRSAT